jgi:alpha/beta superfamily hydrolase
MRLASTMGSESPGGASADSPAVNAFMEVSGFVYSAATIAALTDVDLKAQGVSDCADLLVIDGTSMPVARVWSQEQSNNGVRGTYLVLPGLVEMLMTAPHYASVPTEMISAMRDWLIRLRDLPNATSDNEGSTAGQDFPLHATMQLNGFGLHESITERPVFLASSPLLFGVLTEPPQGQTRQSAVILVNAGADYHIGASGMYVTLARQWARSGYIVLRMDLRGLGDSSTKPGRPDNEVFPPGALDDIRTAVEWVRAQYSIRDVTLGGLCSGAYHTLQAAIAAVPISRALMVNPETFFWNESMSIYDRQTAELVRQPTTYRNKLLSAAFWRRLVTGQIDIRYALGTYAGRYSLALESMFRNVARRLGIRLPNDLGAQLEEAAARGVRLIFVFSRGEPGIELLNIQGGNSLVRLGDGCQIHIIDNADHVFSKVESRANLEKVIGDELSLCQSKSAP